MFHTQDKYRDYVPIEITTNYVAKVDTYFTQNLVGFGLCKGGDGKLRYLKELKNKFEGEKSELSVYQFADTLSPMYDFVQEAAEFDVLLTKKILSVEGIRLQLILPRRSLTSWAQRNLFFGRAD